MCRRFCVIERYIARSIRQSKENQRRVSFVQNAGLTAAGNPLFFAPEVVHWATKHKAIQEVSSAA
jgi:hypothetical protein